MSTLGWPAYIAGAAAVLLLVGLVLSPPFGAVRARRRATAVRR